jgi:hypothetical protein
MSEWTVVNKTFVPVGRFTIAGRGTVQVVKLDQDVPLDGLLGGEVMVDGRTYTVKGVEAPAICRTAYYAGEEIGLLLEGLTDE